VGVVSCERRGGGVGPSRDARLDPTGVAGSCASLAAVNGAASVESMRARGEVEAGAELADAEASDQVDHLGNETWKANLAFSAASRDAVEKALRVGKLLVAARAELADDQWRAHLLGANVTEEQAQLLMQLTNLPGRKVPATRRKPLGSERYKPLLQFLVGLIATSVALVAAAFSVMKDALQKDAVAWKLSLLSFIGWMAAQYSLQPSSA
jgi:hypothetical protein